MDQNSGNENVIKTNGENNNNFESNTENSNQLLNNDINCNNNMNNGLKSEENKPQNGSVSQMVSQNSDDNCLKIMANESDSHSTVDSSSSGSSGVSTATQSSHSTHESQGSAPKTQPLRQRLTYLGSTAINAPRSESEIQRDMAVLNDSPSAMEITLIVPKTPEECVQMLSVTDTGSDPNTASNENLHYIDKQVVMGQFPISRIIFCARGKQDSNERNCFAFTASHGSTFESGVIQCHVFRCQSPDMVAAILQAFGLAFRRVSQNNTNHDMTVVIESGLEIKEDTTDGKTIVCPRDKECFKFKVNAEKKICIAIFQDSTQSRVNLNIEKCFGMLLSPGRNMKHSDMVPIGLLSMSKHATASDNTRKTVTQWQIIGEWNPTEPLFEVLNTETARDTRVYFTIAVDLIVAGIREPVRFVYEAKAKIVNTSSAADKFWINIPALSKGKPLQEQFHIQLREKANSEPDSRYEVISCFSATQLSHQRHKLALRLRHDNNDRMDSHRSSVTSLPTPSNDESEENDEPLPSGTGFVSKECSQSELDGWSELLNKWHQNLSQRPRHVQTLVRRGIPEALRGEVWQLLAGCQDETTLMEQYKVLITRESPYEKYIERDINRTFPAHEFFKESGSLGQDSLFKLCKAYSNYDTEIGYCQGLSFLIAALLLHMPEEQAFCVLAKIMNEYGLRNLFRNGFEELHSKFYQLERAMDSLMPELYSHFADLGVEAHMYASQWFLTLFTAKFPLHVVFPILDLFLLDRMDTIFQVALALLSISKKDLLALDFEGVLKYFRVSLPKKFRTEENGKFLLRTAVSIKIKKLKKYEKEYQLWKESTKVENPIDRLEKENKRLLDTSMRLEQENDDLAQELLTTCNSKIKLRADLDKYEDKSETLSSELLATRSLLVEVEDEKRRLEDEVKCLKEMCRRELERAEHEIARNAKIISEYKQICSQLESRFKVEQNESKESLENILEKVRNCERCAQLIKNNSNNNCNDMNGTDPLSNYSDCLNDGTNQLQQKLDDLVKELAKTKTALAESELKNEVMGNQLTTAQNEITHFRTQNEEAKNTWLSKTLSSIREAATKPHTSSSQGSHQLSRDNSKDNIN